MPGARIWVNEIRVLDACTCVTVAEAHLAEQVVLADQLRATAAALAARPLDGPCDDTCGCTGSDESTSDGCGSGCACVPGDERVDPVPIACSLSGTDVAARVEDWSRVLSQVAHRLPLPGGARLELTDRTQLSALATLVEAEQTCCPFFSFAITVDDRGLALEVTAPTDGQDLLATVFGDTP